MAAKKPTRGTSGGDRDHPPERAASAPEAGGPIKKSHFGTGAPSVSITPLGPQGGDSSNGSVSGIDPVERSLFSQFSAGLYRAAFDPGGREEITRPYEENIFVHSALKVKSTAASSVGLTIWRTDDVESDPLPTGDEFVDLFKKPNPMMSAAKFWAAHVINMALDGENFWFMSGADGMEIEPGAIPTTLWPVRGSLVQVHKRAPNGVPTAWKYGGSDGKQREFSAHAVVQFSEYDPNDMTRGLGTVTVLARAMDLMFQSERYQSGVLKNGGDPGGIITYKKRMGSRQEKDRVQRQVDELFESPENRGRNIVLDSDATYTANKLTAKDMEFHTLWAEMRTTILGALGVPPPLVGVYDHSTYNNLLEAKRDLWLGGLGVLTFLTGVERDMDANFWPLFKGPPSNYVARFDVGGVEALSYANLDKLKESRELVRTGAALSWNDAFMMVGLDIDPPRNADVTWISGALLPVGDVMGGAEDSEMEFSAAEEPGGSGDMADGGGEGEQTDEPVEAGSEPEPSGSSVGFDGAQMEVAARLVVDVEAKRVPRSTGVEMLALLLGIDPAAADKAMADAGKGGIEQVTMALTKAAEVLGNPEPEPELSPRAAFMQDIEERLFKPGDVILFPPVRRWFRNYLSAQLRRIDAVAEGRKSMTKALAGTEGKAPTAAALTELLLLDGAEWEAKLNALFGPKMVKVWADSLTAANASIGGPAVLATDPAVAKLMKTQAIKLAEGVNSSVAKRVRNAMVKVLSSEDFPSSATFRDAIKQVLPKLRNGVKQSVGQIEARAMAIARTESAKAANGARYVQMQESGVQKSEWVSAGDDVVRHSHVSVNGQVRNLGKTFSNGLLYPLDPNGPAGEVVNCRCAARTVETEPEG